MPSVFFLSKTKHFLYQDEEDIVELAKKLLFKGGKAFLADAEIRRVGYQTLDPWEKVKITSVHEILFSS